jgi:hypothetical protein
LIAMSPDAELMLIFGVLHLIAIVLGALLFVMFLRSESTDRWEPPEDDEGGGGGNDRVSAGPKRSPSGGMPLLPDAVAPLVRLRSHDRLADLRPKRDRRPTREPAPHRRPARRD